MLCSELSTASKMAEKRYSYIDEEIDIKPSTELIPDEYEHKLNEKIDVHLFRSFTYDGQANLIETLKSIDLNLEENIHDVKDEETLEKKLTNIKEECQNKDGIMLIFNFYWEEKGKIHFKGSDYDVTKIWQQFTTKNCPSLKNKPKIFIFALEYKDTGTDGASHFTKTMDDTYDTPSEADILIVYSAAIHGYAKDFLENLSYNIKEYGKSEDLLTLVAITDMSPRPVCISTLTRKFYTTVNSERGHQLYINESAADILHALENIHGRIAELEGINYNFLIGQEEIKKKDKRKFSFRNFIGSSSKKEEKKDRNKEKIKEGKIANHDAPTKDTRNGQPSIEPNSMPGTSKKDKLEEENIQGQAIKNRRASNEPRKRLPSVNSDFPKKIPDRKLSDCKAKPPPWK
ncbi:unnamed protein product [Brassicogethes aeneus]|uniref:Caspase family p20 domain-containing protein n=1 Tax=Brassicogethes aeneus TaxID=1431903 RepID=A0A9P0F8U6_BRAAE|nr:unnamed protein product [Brassicogethes aeneus]